MKEIMDSMCDLSLSPSDFIALLFERTSEDGILYIPGWHYDTPGWAYAPSGTIDSDNSYRCKIDWNLAKYEAVTEKFEKLQAAITTIAAQYDEVHEQGDKSALLRGNPALAEVWNLYLKPLDMSEFDGDRLNEIYDKMETVEQVKSIARGISNGEKISEYDKEVLNEYIDLAVTEEELSYQETYADALYRKAEKRLGDNICAYDVYIRARRFCRLIALGAPRIVISNEGQQLAAAFVLHECGSSRELVDNAVRLRLEQMETMSDEELDALCRPQKANTRKSLAPLFVFEILHKYSDTKTHLRQNDILKKLSEYPYEISLERKALSRILHNLTDSSQYAVFRDKSGVWIDQEKKA